MHTMEQLTIEELQRRRQQALAGAERAVFGNRSAYRELKKRIHAVNANPIDVSEYYRTAIRLGYLLEEIDGGRGTIFAHYRDRIDPRRCGMPLYFRFECRDLADQITDLDTRLAEHRCLRVVK